MKIIKWKDSPNANNPHGVCTKKLFESEHITVVHIQLGKGEKLKPHITPVDVMFYIIEGSGLVNIGDETQTVSEGDLIFSPAKIIHGLSNEQSEIFRFLVLKTPTPTEATKIVEK